MPQPVTTFAMNLLSCLWGSVSSPIKCDADAMQNASTASERLMLSMPVKNNASTPIPIEASTCPECGAFSF
ncbi:MAG TPA: hypothetical protein DHV89_09810 [Ruminococcus sp.]|nr:hypothetical protein [Ruminococcus sp.]